MIVIYILIGTLVAGVGSVLVAGFLSINFLSKYGDYFLSFAAGALLSTAFLNLLPEAFHLVDHHSPLTLTLLLGLVFFFLLNKLHLYHHSHDEDELPNLNKKNPSELKKKNIRSKTVFLMEQKRLKEKSRSINLLDY